MPDEPERRSNNPLKTEDAAFRWLMWIAAGAIVLIAIVLIARAL